MHRRRLELEDKAKDSVPQSDATTFVFYCNSILLLWFDENKISRDYYTVYVHTVAHQKQPQGHQQEYVDGHNYV